MAPHLFVPTLAVLARQVLFFVPALLVMALQAPLLLVPMLSALAARTSFVVPTLSVLALQVSLFGPGPRGPAPARGICFPPKPAHHACSRSAAQPKWWRGAAARAAWCPELFLIRPLRASKR